MKSSVQIQMTADQQAKLSRYAKVGLKWISGKISFEEVLQAMGKPDDRFESPNEIEYVYYPDNVMEVSLTFNKLLLVDGKPAINSFNMKVNDNARTSIPYEQWDSLGLHRAKRGELIDGVRTEESDFFVPKGIIDTSGSTPLNYVTFSYRLPMPDDSLFDVNVGTDYLGEWINEKGIKKFDNFQKNPVNLRAVNIYRHYLTPGELQQRNQAKRQKYGYMNLCTGMICPESGLWEGWTKEGPMDILRVTKGDKFDVVRTVSAEKSGTCPMTQGQWMWLCPPDEIRGFVWKGMRLS